MANYANGMRSTYVPGLDDYYAPQETPELVSPEPQRINHEMPAQIADGIRHMDLNSTAGRASAASAHDYHKFSPANQDAPHLSPFPKLTNPPPNVPPSDDELESTLENARSHVLNSNDPEMQLAWAQDALAYCGVCADEADRLLAAGLQQTRPATPRVEHQLKSDAMNVVSFLADQHHPKAEFLRGMWLESGRFGQREDKKEAFRCYSRSADKGYARADYRIGVLYESYNDPIKALKHYHRGVEAGDAASCYRLGMMTLRGEHGQVQDFRRGLELMKKSADGADENAAQGAYVYGMLLARDLTQIQLPEGALPHDERQAKDHIEKAAYMRFAKAQVKMASCYELGALGCDFNPALSIHYNALASRQGEPDADMNLSKWFLVGSDGLLPKNEGLAHRYATRAAATGLPTAEFALGYFNEIGIHVPIDLEKAMGWYQKAAQHGNEDAKGRIVGLTNKQVLSKKDHEDVAISRIKSKHGSVRGGRPERFQQAPARLGRVDEGAAPPHGNNYTQPPARGSSMTPYPPDNTPPRLPPMTSRPGSLAPYPLEDAPIASPYSSPRPNAGPTSGFSHPQKQHYRPGSAVNPEIRPGSAFQFNPELRSNSSASVPQLSHAAQRPYATQGPGPAPRPATAQPPYDPRMRPPPNSRMGPGPSDMQNYPPPNGPGGGGPPPPPLQAQYPPRHTPSAPPVQNIGYKAPYDDRRPNPNAGRPDSIPQTPQQQQRPPTAGRPDTASSRPGSTRPPPESQRPTASRPPQKDSAPPAKPAASAPPASTAPTKPAGPKTFDEMGVPVQKKEECIIM